MKHLANCKPSEFLGQVNRARKAASEWLEKTDIDNIRKTKPEIPDGATDDERRELIAAQVTENVERIFEAALGKYPDETLALLALLCFTEPEDVDTHTVGEYLTAFDEMRQDQAVWRFFTSFLR